MNRINIKVVGVGDSGGNMINHMIVEDILSIDFIVANTDQQGVDLSLAPHKIQLGINVTRGLGADMVPDRGREAALESFEDIKSMLEGADIVFIAAGLGGGTGTGAAPIIAQAAKEIGAFTISIVTSPFLFEGRKRTKLAKEGLEALKRESDSVITVPNEKLLERVEKNLGIKESFRMANDILAQAVYSISKVIFSYGKNDINLDLDDVKTVISHRGLASMGTGYSVGTNAVYDAIKQATIRLQLLYNISIDGAMGILVHFDIHPDCPLNSISKAMENLYNSVDENADIIFGTTTDNKMGIDEVRVTVIATVAEENTEITSDKSFVEKDILDVPTYSRVYSYIDMIETINLWWEGPFSPSDTRCLDVPTFLRKKTDTLDTNSIGSCDELTLYLVYNLVGVYWEPLYIGMETDEFYKIQAEWDIGSVATLK